MPSFNKHHMPCTPHQTPLIPTYKALPFLPPLSLSNLAHVRLQYLKQTTMEKKVTNDPSTNRKRKAEFKLEKIFSIVLKSLQVFRSVGGAKANELCSYICEHHRIPLPDQTLKMAIKDSLKKGIAEGLLRRRRQNGKWYYTCPRRPSKPIKLPIAKSMHRSQLDSPVVRKSKIPFGVGYKSPRPIRKVKKLDDEVPPGNIKNFQEGSRKRVRKESKVQDSKKLRVVDKGEAGKKKPLVDKKLGVKKTMRFKPYRVNSYKPRSYLNWIKSNGKKKGLLYSKNGGKSWAKKKGVKKEVKE